MKIFNIIYAPTCQCNLFVWCTRVYTAYPMSLHGVQILCMVCRFCAWCAGSVHCVHVLCMVWTFCAWCARSVHGCSLSISTTQARFQPLYIYMYMYIEVAVCHFIIIILQLQYNVCSSVRPTEPFCQIAN